MTTLLSDQIDTEDLPEGDRRAVELIQRAMERLGFEITTVRREGGSTDHWQVHWRVKGKGITASYGASAETAAAAARAALTNAVSSLHEAKQNGRGL